MKEIKNHKHFTHFPTMLNSVFIFAFVLLIISSKNQNFYKNSKLSKDCIKIYAYLCKMDVNVMIIKLNPVLKVNISKF